jgi:hypothetical protein
MKSSFILALCTAAFAQRRSRLSDQIPSDVQKLSFLQYTANEGKNYKSTREFKTRMQNWTATDNYIKNYKAPGVVLKHNMFSDWSDREKADFLPARKPEIKTSAK